MKTNFLFLILFNLSFFYISAQNSWHVAMNGSDTTGSGSVTNPYKTLQRTINGLQAGDTVFVHQGIYHNLNYNDSDIWNNDNLLTLNNVHGNSSNYIVFIPYQDEIVTLESDSNYNVLIKNSSYIKFQGFIVKGNADSITLSEAQGAWGLYKDSNGNVHHLDQEMNIDITDPSLIGQTINKPATPNITKPYYYNGKGLATRQSHHIIFENNKVKDMTGSAIRADKSDYITIKNNEVYHNTYWTSAGVGAITVAEATVTPSSDTNTDVKIKLINNYVHHNENRIISWAPSKSFIKMVIDEGTGLFLTRNKDTYTNGKILIANNISAFNGASGITCHKTDNAIIEFNTVFKNGTTNDSAAGGIGVNSASNVNITNNISYAEPDHWALGKLGGTLTNISISNNLLYNENGSQTIHKNMPNGWVEDNPLFNDATTFDFTLQSNSPAINSGIFSTTTTVDYLNNNRDDGMPDIGAYEYGATNVINQFNLKTFDIYPNPTTNILFVKGIFNKNEYIDIYDSFGRKITSFLTSKDTNLLQLDVSNIANGMYFVKSKHLIKKLLKN